MPCIRAGIPFLCHFGLRFGLKFRLEPQISGLELKTRWAWTWTLISLLDSTRDILYLVEGGLFASLHSNILIVVVNFGKFTFIVSAMHIHLFFMLGFPSYRTFDLRPLVPGLMFYNQNPHTNFETFCLKICCSLGYSEVDGRILPGVGQSWPRWQAVLLPIVLFSSWSGYCQLSNKKRRHIWKGDITVLDYFFTFLYLAVT